MNIGSIVLTIATSILTTLIVEYFAKPYSEARKDRILEKYRSFRAVDSATQKIQTGSSRVGGVGGEFERPESSEFVAPIIDRERMTILESAKKIEDCLDSNGRDMPEVELDYLMRYSAYVQALTASSPLRPAAAREIYRMTRPLVIYLNSRGLRRMRRGVTLRSALAPLKDAAERL